MHDSAESVVIVNRIVLDAAIVPEGERARLPAETASELGTDLMREQVIEKGLVFSRVQPWKWVVWAALT